MVYLIRRHATTTREELIAHWFANHMPAVIARTERQSAAGELHAEHYAATLFDGKVKGPGDWDGGSLSHRAPEAGSLWRGLQRPKLPGRRGFRPAGPVPARWILFAG